MAMKKDKWQSLLDQFQEGPGKIYFPKAGKTRMKLVTPKERDEYNFFEEVTNSYGKRKWLVLGYVVNLADEEEAPKIRGILLPKTAIRGILNLLAEGHDLLSEDGNGITLTRTGLGKTDTSYSVVPSANPQPLPEGIIWPDETLDELAEAFTVEATRRSGRQDNDIEEDEEDLEGAPPWEGEDEEEEEAPAPPRKRSKPTGSRRSKRSRNW